MLDQFESSDSSTNASSISQQQPWITSELNDAKTNGMQTFVLAIKTCSAETTRTIYLATSPSLTTPATATA